MQIERGEIITFVSAVAAAFGYGVRHFLPLVFKRSFWRYCKRGVSDVLTEKLSDGKSALSFAQHAALCAPMQKQLDEGAKQFKLIHESNARISKEVRWLRALAVVQALPEAIKKADEIIGKDNLS